ncbi:glycosyltransferase family 4 protein [Halobellus litoreus]|uniref:Glycosyltransferase family 4 protein n=1 Tax=Halobellus litoreus TaxID=755310 RepID=A0ABD6DY30_9EURY|nr:glycosyltransferase family 4 protein [Halobellus litoreus]
MTQVAILTSSHSTFDTRIFHKQARSLIDGGYDVTLITPHSSDQERSGVTIKAVDESDVNSADVKHILKIYAEAKRTDADIYHLHDPGLLPAGLLLSLEDKKVIYDCHEDYGRAFKYYDSVPFNPVISRVYPPIQSTIAKRLDGVIAATDWIADDFRARGHENVALVRNFPRVSMVGDETATIDHDHEYSMVYVGGLSTERGLEDMLYLTAELRRRNIDVDLWLLGRIDIKAREEIERITTEKRIKDHVKTFGYVDPDEIFRYLRAADLGLCLLYSGRAEYIIPTKMFEYMLAEIPVLATRTTGTQKYLPDDCGRTVANDRDDQADAAEEILTNPELQNKMGKRGAQKVRNEYCWEVEAEQLLELYRDLT